MLTTLSADLQFVGYDVGRVLGVLLQLVHIREGLSTDVLLHPTVAHHRPAP